MNDRHARAVTAVLAFGAASALGAGAMASPTPRTAHARASVHRAGTIGTAVIGQLHHIVTIGSTVDPVNGDQNPYGLAIAQATSGMITQGDLVICNFNDGLNNIQGLGTTIEVLHPTPGSNPQRFAQDTRLTGCNAIALTPDDDEPWVAAFTANDNPVLESTGKFVFNLAGAPYAQPWGQAFSGTKGPFGATAFYESNSNDGTIVRIGITKKGAYTSHIIASGFPVNHGVPGTVLAPSGLTYDALSDTLYIIEGESNRVVAFHHVTLIPPHGVTVNGNVYGGIAGSLAETVYRGAPLAAPISAALLFNGNIVVGNTTNNVLVEINPTRHAVVSMKNLDRGAAGALFGIAAAGTSVATTQIFFNDDNDNTVKVLQP